MGRCFRTKGVVFLAMCAWVSPTVSWAGTWRVTGGATTLWLEPRVAGSDTGMGTAGQEMFSRSSTTLVPVTFEVEPNSLLEISVDRSGVVGVQGDIRHIGELTLGRRSTGRMVKDFVIRPVDRAGRSRFVLAEAERGGFEGLTLQGIDIQFERVASAMIITSDEIRLSPEWAEEFGTTVFAFEDVGFAVIEVSLELVSDGRSAPEAKFEVSDPSAEPWGMITRDFSLVGGPSTCSDNGLPCASNAECNLGEFCHFPGPDIIVSSISGMGFPGSELTCHDSGMICSTDSDCRSCSGIGGNCALPSDCTTCSAGGDSCDTSDDCKSCTGGVGSRRCGTDSDCGTCNLSGTPCANSSDCDNDVCVLLETCESVEICDSVETCDATGEACDVAIAAFAVGTRSCNIGDMPALWVQQQRFHPVIGQNMYRLVDDRFEQIGMSWVKHGFQSTNDDVGCGTCVHPGTITLLGVGCSDLYSSSLNGNRVYLGPRSDINAHSGEFVFPFDAPEYANLIERRVQVHEEDLVDTTVNTDTLYFVDGHYVTWDDAQAGNGNNNASYRPINITGPHNPPSVWRASVSAENTSIGQQGIRAWKDLDNSVVETEIQIPGEGLLILSAKAIDLGGGLWRYEYALLNFNSDRSIGSFSIPLPQFPTVTEIGFHDVDYHSGDPYDRTDWDGVVADGSITWATESYQANPNANALRWGTLYNFRFDINAAPAQSTTVTLGLFKPGSSSEVTASTVGPVSFIDCNGNGTADACDLSCAPAGCSLPKAPPCGTVPADCDSNNVLDECQADCDNNNIPDVCDISEGDSLDCNENLVPDECEIDENSTAPGGPFLCTEFCDPDCNENGLPDDCDTFTDDDEDGFFTCEDVCPNTNPGARCDCEGFLGDCALGNGTCWSDQIFFPRITTEFCINDLLGIPECMESPLCRDGCLVGDANEDGSVDLREVAVIQNCFGVEGQDADYVECLRVFDFNLDGVLDLADFELFQDLYYNGPPPSNGPCVWPN